MTLLDAGPLVALVHASDQEHDRCRTALGSIRRPLCTVWPVITEALYLLDFSWEAQDAVWDMLEEGGVTLIALDAADVPRMRALMRKYRDLPMDVADAALVTVAEREGITRVFTLDRRDFEVYRPAKIGRFSLVP
ncbi:MAG: PIN domain-containing protein [Candidatus Rokubacteria bacterium]|nr:PIN domain-containing protein [Candidatus Rokubacteria bacterium]